MTNYMNIQVSLAALMAAAEKFGGFVTPNGVTSLVGQAASALEAGKEQEATSLLRDAQTELARNLRAFINNSPSFFAAKLAAMNGLDLGLRARLERAIVVYGRDVRGAGWEPSARMYNTVAGLVAGAPAVSERIKAAKAALIRRRMDAADAAAAEVEKAEAARKEATIVVARQQAAQKLRQMVARKAA